MPKRQFDRDDNAFNKLEKAVERLFDLGYSGSEIIRSVEIRFNELAGHDPISEHAVNQAIDRTCACDAPVCAPEEQTIGWCDACGMEVTDPESACAGRDKTAEEVIIERLDALEREVLALKNAEFLRKTTTINQPPWRPHLPYVQPLTPQPITPQWSPQFGMGGGTWSPPPNRPQNTCGPHCHTEGDHHHY